MFSWMKHGFYLEFGVNRVKLYLLCCFEIRGGLWWDVSCAFAFSSLFTFSPSTLSSQSLSHRLSHFFVPKPVHSSIPALPKRRGSHFHTWLGEPWKNDVCLDTDSQLSAVFVPGLQRQGFYAEITKMKIKEGKWRREMREKMVGMERLEFPGAGRRKMMGWIGKREGSWKMSLNPRRHPSLQAFGTPLKSHTKKADSREIYSKRTSQIQSHCPTHSNHRFWCLEPKFSKAKNSLVIKEKWLILLCPDLLLSNRTIHPRLSDREKFNQV